MSTEKQSLMLLLQQKKTQLKDLQDKCQLQNKKIKLFRKQNQDLTSVIDQKQQSDTTLLLNSKQLLANNNKLQKTIQQLKQQLQLSKSNQLKSITNNNLANTQSQHNNKQNTQKTLSTIKHHPTILSINEITVTQHTHQLDLPNCQLTDNDILPLQRFIQLKALILNQNLLNSPSVVMICSSLVNLQKLNLANNQFTSQSLQHIKNLKHLKVLDIRNNNLNDQALKHISQVTTLCDLSCSKNSLTDLAASYLPNLSNLTYLDITNNLLTSSSAKYLSKLDKVSHLYLMSNKLSKQGIIQIIQSVKNLQFLDVRFNVWNNDQKELIKKAKHQKLEVFC